MQEWVYCFWLSVLMPLTSNLLETLLLDKRFDFNGLFNYNGYGLWLYKLFAAIFFFRQAIA